MEQERVRELLDKFYEGRTSEEEEAQLRSYLSAPDVSFTPGTGSGYLTEMSPEVPEPSEDFYARLEAVTRSDADIKTGMAPSSGDEPSTETQLHSVIKARAVVPNSKEPFRFGMKSQAGERPQTLITRGRGIMRYAMTIAAAAAIVTGVYLIIDFTGRKEMQDTYQDPEIAMAEVRSILMTVSEKMNTGTESLGSMNSMNIAPGTLDELGKINSMVGEKLSVLRYLDRVAGSENITDNN